MFECSSVDRTRVDGLCDFEKVRVRVRAKVRVKVRVRVRVRTIFERRSGDRTRVDGGVTSRRYLRVRARVRRSLRV